MGVEKATFGAGCFWGVEETFQKVPGVKTTAVGFMGGRVKNPTYEQVCAGTSGHAEVLQLVFDPEEVSYDQLLDVFWRCHNPTTLNRQGPDIGEQYRSVIFCHGPEQTVIATKSKETLDQAGVFPNPIVTDIEPATVFYHAEEYHQQYLAKRGLPGCHF